MSTVALVALLNGCVSSHLDMTPVNSRNSPYGVSATYPQEKGRIVLWGGTIVSLTNLKQGAQVQVLSYPVSHKNGYPKTRSRSDGRFIVRHETFLEPQDYTAGSLITVVGTITGLTEDVIQDVRFDLPVIESQQIELWGRPYEDRAYPNIGFGIGFGF